MPKFCILISQIQCISVTSNVGEIMFCQLEFPELLTNSIHIPKTDYFSFEQISKLNLYHFC